MVSVCFCVRGCARFTSLLCYFVLLPFGCHFLSCPLLPFQNSVLVLLSTDSGSYLHVGIYFNDFSPFYPNLSLNAMVIRSQNAFPSLGGATTRPTARMGKTKRIANLRRATLVNSTATMGDAFLTSGTAMVIMVRF